MAPFSDSSKLHLRFRRFASQNGVTLRLATLALACLAVSLPALAQTRTAIEVGKFSNARPGGPFPEGWGPWILTQRKKLTSYSLIDDGGTVVVQAVADDSASGLIRRIRIDPKEYPIVQWRWKAANLIPSADNHKRSKEDSPVRLYIGFEGDIAKLGFTDLMFFKVVKAASGQEMPYATLNYIWENNDPVDAIIPNPNTGRIQMIVVESGPARLNQWRSYERNVYEDYKRAFGEEPPAIMGVFLMTDTDNTDERATGYYGDIVFKRAAK